MARKINLKQLYNIGELDIQLVASTVEDVTSNGVASIIDGDSSTSLYLRLDDNAILAYNFVALVFSTPIQGKKFRFKTKTLSSNMLYIVAGDSNTPSTLTGFYTSSLKDIDPDAPTETIFDFDTNNNAITTLILGIADTPYGGDSYVYEVELYILEEANPYEFNDSVLTTKAWNSSRYDGRQLQASTINKFTNGDITYGKTPVLQNYTRNIYIASDVISLSPNDDNTFEDPNLPFIKDFSFVIINEIITINKDDSVTSVNLNNVNSFKNIKGIQREFQFNNPIKSNITLFPTDVSISDKTKKTYSIYFNEGLLRGVLDYQNTDAAGEFIYYPTGSSSTQTSPFFQVRDTIPVDDSLGGIVHTKDSKLIRNILGPSFDFTEFSGGDGAVILNTIFYKIINESYNDPSNKKYYLSFCTTSSFSHSFAPTSPQLEVINFEVDSGFSDNAYNILPTTTPSNETTRSTRSTLSGLSTIKIEGFEPGETRSSWIGGKGNVSMSSFPFNSSELEYKPNSPSIPSCQGYSLTELDNSRPALLINLSKNELPNNRGSKPMVILPENIHPFIKDNLIYFLAQAGLDIGDRKILPTLNESNRNLK